MGSQRHSLHEASETQRTASSLEPETQKPHCLPLHHILPHSLQNHPIKQKKNVSISEMKNFLVCVVKLPQNNLFWDVAVKTKARLTDLVMNVELVPSLLGVLLSFHVGGNMTDESSPPTTSFPSASFRGKGSPHATKRSINLLSPTSKL